MIDTTAVAKRFASWQRTHPPNTGYTKGVFTLLDEKARNGEYPEGTNLFIEAALQYTGMEEATDNTRWDLRERRIPYSQTYRLSLDGQIDCSSWPYIFLKNFFGIDIGTWTEAQYDRIPRMGGRRIAWENRRPCDLVQYNFKDGRRVSHDAIVGPKGYIIHTTSESNPFRMERDTYAASKRVCVWRILSDAQYESLIVRALQPDPIFQHAMYLTRPLMQGRDVEHYQGLVKDYLAAKSDPYARMLAGLLKINATYGLTTYYAVKRAQEHLGLPGTGGIDRQTAARLDGVR